MNSLDLWFEFVEVRKAYVGWRDMYREVRHDYRGALAAEQAQRDGNAIAAARGYYRHLPALTGGHPWLEARSLPVVQGMKASKDGELVIPIIRGGAVGSVLMIGSEMRFWPGSSPVGTFPIARPGATLTVLVEGLAPGLAIFAATPTAKVLVWFGSVPDQKYVGLVTVAGPAPVGDWCEWRISTVAERLENRGRRERETDIRRAVDAEIAAAMAKHAQFRPLEEYA